MPWKWMVIIGLAIGFMLMCWTMKCFEVADKVDDKMSTVYEQMLKANPTAAGKEGK
jgi:hypothetical protein